MRRFFPTTIPLLGLLALAQPASARSGAAKPDAEAMAEARGAGSDERYASSKAYTHYLAGKLAEEKGDLQEALLQYRQALLSGEGAPAILTAMGRLHLRLGEGERAAAYLRRALEADPEHAEAHLWTARLQMVREEHEEAAASLERVLALGHEGEEVHFSLIDLHWRRGDLPAAEAAARRHAKAHPGNGRAWLVLAQLAGSEGLHREELIYLRRAVDADPSDVAACLALARREERAGRADRAAVLWRRVLEREPTAPEALLGLAKRALRQGDEATAQAYLRQIFRSSPNEVAARIGAAVELDEARLPGALNLLHGMEGRDPRVPFLRGAILEGQGRWQEALEAYRAVPAASGPLYVMAKAREAAALSMLGSHEDALRLLQAAWKLGARLGGVELRAEVARSIPEVYRRARRSEEAVVLLRGELAFGGPAPLVYALARALQDVGQAEDAVELLRGMEGEESDEAHAFALAEALERAGDPMGAVAVIRKLLEADPDHVLALNFVGYVLADNDLELEEARRHLVRALELRPDEAAILDSLGWCELKRGDLKAARPLLERAAALRPDEPEILHHLAELNHLQGRTEEALPLWREALRRLQVDPDARLEKWIVERLGAVSGDAQADKGP